MEDIRRLALLIVKELGALPSTIEALGVYSGLFIELSQWERVQKIAYNLEIGLFYNFHTIMSKYLKSIENA